VKERVLRFVLGGGLVSVFAVLGDVLKPQRFAGLFAAAPSVALATLALAIIHEGDAYAATEARSMMAGAVALFAYAGTVSRLMHVHRWHAVRAVAAATLVWFAVAFGMWSV
jgi:hypothetical protein